MGNQCLQADLVPLCLERKNRLIFNSKNDLIATDPDKPYQVFCEHSKTEQPCSGQFCLRGTAAETYNTLLYFPLSFLTPGLACERVQFLKGNSPDY